jgi:Organic solute transporter Ostalpha
MVLVVAVTPLSVLVFTAGLFSAAACGVSFFLIFKHQANLTWFSVQIKICGILWIVPIYATTSWLALLVPSAGLYFDLLRCCYESYVLYLFLSLMLSYLNADLEYDTVASVESTTEDATHLGLGVGGLAHTGSNGYQQLVEYLEKKRPPPRLPFPFSALPCCAGDLPAGSKFLRWCKAGTLQYCVVRPLTTVVAVVLNVLGLYGESNFHLNYGFLYLTVVVNISIAFAFVVLVTFYTALKKKLAPFSPFSKFLCIKAVIFATFWQAIVIAVAVKVGTYSPIWAPI